MSADYRKQLVEFEQKIGEGFDKTLIALSGGALGLSIAFIKDIVGANEMKHEGHLIASWSFWALSLGSILFAFYFGQLAYRKAITQVDNNTIDTEVTGGIFTPIVNWLNAIGAVSFLLGVISIIVFSIKNLGLRGFVWVKSSNELMHYPVIVVDSSML